MDQFLPVEWQELMHMLAQVPRIPWSTVEQRACEMMRANQHKLSRFMTLLSSEVPCESVLFPGEQRGSLPVLCLAPGTVQRAFAMLILSQMHSSLFSLPVRDPLLRLGLVCDSLGHASAAPLWQAVRGASRALGWKESSGDGEQDSNEEIVLLQEDWQNHLYFRAALENKQHITDVALMGEEKVVMAQNHGRKRKQSPSGTPSRQAIKRQRSEEEETPGGVVEMTMTEDGSHEEALISTTQTMPQLSEEEKEQAVALGSFFASAATQQANGEATDMIREKLAFLREMPNQAFGEACALLQSHTWSEEAFLLFCENLLDEVSVHKSKQFMSTCLVRRLAGLTNPASRLLLSRVLAVSKVHAKLVSKNLVLPLLKQPTAGKPQYEVVSRIVKECLDASLSFGMLRNMMAQRVELVWSDGTIKLVCTLVNVADSKADFATQVMPSMVAALQFVSKLPASQFGSAKKAVTDSLLFSRWLSTLVSKQPQACAAFKSALTDLAATLTSLLKKSVAASVARLA